MLYFGFGVYVHKTSRFRYIRLQIRSASLRIALSVVDMTRHHTSDIDFYNFVLKMH